MNSKIILQNENSYVVIDAGELTSFKNNGIEYIHQKENKGWRKSDDELFPIIGPTSKNNFRVYTKRGNAILDQHGLLRELDYRLIYNDKSSANFTKNYHQNTAIKNSKYPKKSTEKNVFWPYEFSFEKNFKLKKNVLTIDFFINSDIEMPFMFGYHPAFLLSNTGNEMILSDSEKITLDAVLKAGARAYLVLNSEKLILTSTKRDLEISTKGFNNFMLWTEVKNMICIEPITHYPLYESHKYSEENMRISSGRERFSVMLKIL